MAVDNYRQRLDLLEELLRHVFPKDEIVTFCDPFRAVQYGSRNNVDMVFADMNLRPFSGIALAGLIRKLNEDATVYYIVDSSDSMRDTSVLVRPVTEETVRELIGQ